MVTEEVDVVSDSLEDSVESDDLWKREERNMRKVKFT